MSIPSTWNAGASETPIVSDRIVHEYSGTTTIVCPGAALEGGGAETGGSEK